MLVTSGESIQVLNQQLWDQELHHQRLLGRKERRLVHQWIKLGIKLEIKLGRPLFEADQVHRMRP
eukprot:m.307014 g.307014  ORF g.307014 m.307014 type:complete len:65 (+) comp41816_c0_seq1:2569-2763(+)